MTTFLF